MDAGGERTRAGLRRQKRADAAGGVEAAEAAPNALLKALMLIPREGPRSHSLIVYWPCCRQK